MALDTILQQGRFTADGSAKILQIRSDLDWIKVYNETAAAQAAADLGYEFYYQRGMTPGRGVVWTKLGTVANDPVTVGQIAAGAGFTIIDSSINVPGANTALTAITAANPAVVTSAGHGLIVGDVVRFNTLDNQSQIGGMDFTVTAAGATFTIGNINLANSTASTAGFWRKIPYDPIYYPRRRFITWVENAVQPKVYMSVTHGYVVGQKVRFQFPGGAAVWGNYAAMDGQEATIIAVGVARAGSEPNNGGTANNIQVDFDTSSYGSWNVFGAANNEGYPASTAVPFSPAQVVPLGEDTAEALSAGTNLLSDATVNQSYIGVNLAAGTASPAGATSDVIYWVAGKSFSVDNQ